VLRLATAAAASIEPVTSRQPVTGKFLGRFLCIPVPPRGSACPLLDKPYRRPLGSKVTHPDERRTHADHLTLQFELRVTVAKLVASSPGFSVRSRPGWHSARLSGGAELRFGAASRDSPHPCGGGMAWGEAASDLPALFLARTSRYRRRARVMHKFVSSLSLIGRGQRSDLSW
jgi:hypothetical protein